MTYKPQDHFFKKAKDEGYLARSVYKLKEIQKKFRILRQGNSVLDLGCAPGSWSQVTMEIIGDKGHLLGIDLTEVRLNYPNAVFFQKDIFAVPKEEFAHTPYDCILSDMAPKTTGIKFTDQARSEELCLKTVELSDQLLKVGGHLVMKLFEGQGANQIAAEVKKRFTKLERFKPEATRSISKEIYLIGLSKK